MQHKAIKNKRALLATSVALALSTLALSAAAQTSPKLGLGLRELAAQQQGLSAANSRTTALAGKQALRAGDALLFDAQERVRVKVTLDGQQPLPAVLAATEGLGSRVLASSDKYRKGVLTAYVPVGALNSLAETAGVRSVVLALGLETNVGATTSQGAPAMRTDQVNAQGITGAGITVGVMSDSYNTSTNAVKAANDVASGDLPGAGNPLGNTAEVVVVKDQAGGSDEGRAMAQIVHDLAPGAKLCFATAYNTEVDFANNIRALADKSGACKADVIVDDIIYLAEPFFSDGIVAQAADEVAAAGVPYFSSAGNRSASQGYLSDFRSVSKAAATTAGQSVNLALIADADSSGGFHNFNSGAGAPDVSQTIQFGANGRVVFQWNDPFDAGRVTTDYDIYLFNAAGTAIVYSSKDDNLATDQPLEYISAPAATYQLVVVRKGAAPATPVASKLRYVLFGSVVNAEYVDYNTPVTYGHNSAAGAIGTAAIPWFQTYQPESFTSPGMVRMYFDRAGNRLAEPEVRMKPDVAAIDGVNTTFFSSDSAEDADTFPNFFGTSAAAPHAAAVAALLLQKAGGPGSLTPAQVRSVLQSTALPHSLQPNLVEAVAIAGAAKVTVSAEGNGDTPSSFNPNAFKLSMVAPAGYTLQNVVLDLSTANAARVRLGVPAPGMLFDPRAATTGYPLTLGALKNISAGQISFSRAGVLANTQFDKLTVNFTAGAFGNKSSMGFGVDRDERATGGGGNAADLLAGATVSGVVAVPGGGTIPFSTTLKPRQFAKGFSPLDGFGLIDALSAVNAVNPLPTKSAR
ncbi:hypothetical protein HNP55_004430 [Paucibacter oligotrophus]|uniref:Peptidase S8/S53 domain-containing protein n=1 Tax=Roseateles oligotrophus TaxID=1769250 RepID=A0A840LCJ3_9BURK|nr:S8 family serine peptidase [Roseateles oligotrophus]MBB4845876.1 hypothetical protein [Roseateles oligotrophus]